MGLQGQHGGLSSASGECGGQTTVTRICPRCPGGATDHGRPQPGRAVGWPQTARCMDFHEGPRAAHPSGRSICALDSSGQLASRDDPPPDSSFQIFVQDAEGKRVGWPSAGLGNGSNHGHDKALAPASTQVINDLPGHLLPCVRCPVCAAPSSTCCSPVTPAALGHRPAFHDHHSLPSSSAVLVTLGGDRRGINSHVPGRPAR